MGRIKAGALSLAGFVTNVIDRATATSSLSGADFLEILIRPPPGLPDCHHSAEQSLPPHFTIPDYPSKSARRASPAMACNFSIARFSS